MCVWILVYPFTVEPWASAQNDLDFPTMKINVTISTQLNKKVVWEMLIWENNAGAGFSEKESCIPWLTSSVCKRNILK